MAVNLCKCCYALFQNPLIEDKLNMFPTVCWFSCMLVDQNKVIIFFP